MRKTRQLAIRFSEKDYARLTTCSLLASSSRAEFIRDSVKAAVAKALAKEAQTVEEVAA